MDQVPGWISTGRSAPCPAMIDLPDDRTALEPAGGSGSAPDSCATGFATWCAPGGSLRLRDLVGDLAALAGAARTPVQATWTDTPRNWKYVWKSNGSVTLRDLGARNDDLKVDVRTVHAVARVRYQYRRIVRCKLQFVRSGALVPEADMARAVASQRTSSRVRPHSR